MTDFSRCSALLASALLAGACTIDSSPSDTDKGTDDDNGDGGVGDDADGGDDGQDDGQDDGTTGADDGPGTTGDDDGDDDGTTGEPPPVEQPCAIDDGRCIFRHDTFGDEQLWTDVLRLHELVQELPPTMALALGLKVDAEAVPTEVLASADLEDPATTVALLELDAVVGVRAQVVRGTVTRIGITCALCHSSVDDSVAPGIGARLDGWPNRDLDPGAIIAATPGLPALADSLGVATEAAHAALSSWGPGRYDARFNQDLMSAPVLIPPAYGLANVALETYTGEGPISYWNAYVAVTQMGGQGNFTDEELGIDIMHDPDLVTDKLPALRDYQFSLGAPPPPTGSFDAVAAARGEAVFQSNCASCHAGAAFTDAPTLHEPSETAMEPLHAARSTTGLYRTTPLRGAWQHPPYFHDGSAADFAAVVAHYDAVLGLQLDETERADLVAYLQSL